MFRVLRRTVKSAHAVLPAPSGGINRKDPLSDMSVTDAVQMDNYMPLDGKVVLRPGYKFYAETGVNAANAVETLAVLNVGNLQKFVAVSGGAFYDVSGNEAVLLSGASVTKSRCQTVKYKNKLYFVNGTDVPKVFSVDDDVCSVADWEFVGIGLTEEKIISGAVSHEFLWFVEKNTLKAWYSAVAGNVSGELKCFDLASVSKKGGALVSVANWTIDGGTGVDDLTCFLTSEGEILLYKGYNPNDAENFKLVGSYMLSKPIGYQSVLEYQGDLVIISEDGYVPLSKALSLNKAGISAVAFSDKIRGLVLERTAAFKNLEGWQGIIYSKKGYALFNVPLAVGFEQHVINLNTGAWCRFTNINAKCWCIFKDDLYFAYQNRIFKFDAAYSDDGMPIEGKIVQAYSDFDVPSLKKIVLLNPKISALTKFNLTMYANMDYAPRKEKFYVKVGYNTTTKWGEVKWSHSKENKGSKWQTYLATKISTGWFAHSATGVKASLVFETKTSGNKIEWYETGIRFETGTGIL